MPAQLRFDYSRSFFSSIEVKKAVDKASRRILSQFGAFTRRTAKQSIRKGGVNGRTSLPGEPPRSHTGHLRNFIWFGWDNAHKGIVIGPVKLMKKGSVPESLEYGGTVTRHRNHLRSKNQRRGGVGVIRVQGMRERKRDQRGRFLKMNATGRRVLDKRGRPVHVFYGRLYTDKQVAESKRIETEFFGKERVGGRLAARPFMRPAAQKNIRMLPRKWRDAVR